LEYGKVDKNEKDITTPSAETYGDKFQCALLEEGTRNSPGQTTPVSFWSIDPSSSMYSATKWTLGLTRSIAGVADITTGAERPGFISYEWKNDEIYRSTKMLMWKTESTEGTDTGTDTDEGTGTAEDGAISLAAYSTAICAAVASLMF